MFGFTYEGPQAILYRCVWIPGLASGALLAALPIADRLTPNDPNIGVLLRSIGIFALGLSTLATILFVALLFFRDVPRSVKLRAFAAAIFPYIVGAILWLVATTAAHRIGHT
ncbi:MAG: hypothetical protein JO119_06795 [Acidobacteria bacterium]|nr:hypothetical protein [Acidobacteriota bacterium]